MRYLHVPCKAGGVKCLLSVFADGRLYTQLWIETGEDADFTACIPVPSDSVGYTVSNDSVRHLIDVQEGKPAAPLSPYRFHFAPACGWMNDPNGLFFDGELYHLYFQHNPVSKEWGNLSWGHAVSRNLLDWQELDIAMLPPNTNEYVYSGSAVIEGEEPAVYYTINVNNNPYMNTQRRRVLRGGALTDESTVIGPTARGARDPKVFYRNGREYIVLYLSGSDFALYVKDGGAWVRCDTFSAPPAWECPDFISVSGQLVFASADGFYWLADITDEGRVRFLSGMKRMFVNSVPYASQTFFGVPDRTVMISWERIKAPSLPSTGVMGVPRELSLNAAGEMRLSPVRELFALARGAARSSSRTLCTEAPAFMLRIEGGAAFKGAVNGTDVSFSGGVLNVAGSEARFPAGDLVLLADGPVLEVADGEFVANACFELAYPPGATRLEFDRDARTALSIF